MQAHLPTGRACTHRGPRGRRWKGYNGAPRSSGGANACHLKRLAGKRKQLKNQAENKSLYHRCTNCLASRDTVTGSSSSATAGRIRSEEHKSELQSPCNLVCRLLLEKKTMADPVLPLRLFKPETTLPRLV